MPGSLPSRPSDTAPSDQNPDEVVILDDHPASRLVLYFTGDPGVEYGNVFSLSAAVEARGWTVAEVRSDVDGAKMAWLRKGLLSAITIVCHGRADGIAMFETVHEGLTADDQNWLRQRVGRFGGFLHVIPDDREATPS